MNDTLAVIGTPLVLLLAKQHRMSPKVLLLALAFAVTIGSVVSPIGNPQNLLGRDPWPDAQPIRGIFPAPRAADRHQPARGIFYSEIFLP